MKFLLSLCFVLCLFGAPLRAQNAIPVGFSDIDEQVRNLQLLGKVDANQSMLARPFYSTGKQSMQDLYRLIDPTAIDSIKSYKKGLFQAILLPASLSQKLNTSRPYGWNDQAMSFSNGYQMQASAGIYARFSILHIQFKPEFVHTGSAEYETSDAWGQVNPSIDRYSLGQSSVRLEAGGISLGVSNQNLWWGPGHYSSLLMTNNAPGFLHYSFNTTRPLKTPIGSFEFQLILGRMTRDSLQGYENAALKRRDLSDRPKYRQYNGIVLTYQPRFMKNVFFSVSRAFQNYEADKPGAKFMNTYLPVLNNLFKNDYNDDTLSKDQILSISTRWLMPKNHAEVYAEFGYNDAKQNLRDLWLDMAHSSAWVVGFKKLHPLTNRTFIEVFGEATKMAQSPSYLMRSAGNWYEHGQVTEGFSNNNQIIGNGVGHGNNVQTLGVSWNQGWKKIGLTFQHVAQNPMLETGQSAVRTRLVKWDDYAFGLQGGYRYKKLLFTADVKWVNSSNYLWEADHSKSNLNAFINTIFLW
jgi:hypothetical protein